LFLGHLGDNNVHIQTGPHDPGEWLHVEELVYSALRGRQGTISAEHGIGFLKKNRSWATPAAKVKSHC